MWGATESIDKEEAGDAPSLAQFRRNHNYQTIPSESMVKRMCLIVLEMNVAYNLCYALIGDHRITTDALNEKLEL